MNKVDINPEHKVYITQKALILNDQREILIIRRSETAPARSLGWDIIGGSLQFGEDPKVGITREIEEETSLSVSNIKPLDVVYFLEGDIYTLMIGYIAQSMGTEIKLSFEHDQYRWVSKEVFLKTDLPETYKNFVKLL